MKDLTLIYIAGFLFAASFLFIYGILGIFLAYHYYREIKYWFQQLRQRKRRNSLPEEKKDINP